MNGGSGVAIMSFPSSVTVSVSPGTNTVTPVPGCKQIARFTVTGTLEVS